MSTTQYLPVQEHVHRCHLDCLSHQGRKRVSFSPRDTQHRQSVDRGLTLLQGSSSVKLLIPAKAEHKLGI